MHVFWRNLGLRWKSAPLPRRGPGPGAATPAGVRGAAVGARVLGGNTIAYNPLTSHQGDTHHTLLPIPPMGRHILCPVPVPYWCQGATGWVYRDLWTS